MTVAHTLSLSHRPTVLRKLKSLTVLDGCPISASEKAMFGENAGALSMATIMQHGSAGQRFGITGAWQLALLYYYYSGLLSVGRMRVH